MKVANKEMSVRKLWTSNELLDAVSARKAVSIGKLRGEALRTALSEMRDPELMAFLSNVDVSRVAKIVAVSFHRRHRPPACHRRRQRSQLRQEKRAAPHRRAMRSHAPRRSRRAAPRRLFEREEPHRLRSRAHGHERLRLAFPLRRHLGRRAVRGSVLLHEHP